MGFEYHKTYDGKMDLHEDSNPWEEMRKNYSYILIKTSDDDKDSVCNPLQSGNIMTITAETFLVLCQSLIAVPAACECKDTSMNTGRRGRAPATRNVGIQTMQRPKLKDVCSSTNFLFQTKSVSVGTIPKESSDAETQFDVKEAIATVSGQRSFLDSFTEGASETQPNKSDNLFSHFNSLLLPLNVSNVMNHSSEATRITNLEKYSHNRQTQTDIQSAIGLQVQSCDVGVQVESSNKRQSVIKSQVEGISIDYLKEGSEVLSQDRENLSSSSSLIQSLRTSNHKKFRVVNGNISQFSATDKKPNYRQNEKDTKPSTGIYLREEMQLVLQCVSEAIRNVDVAKYVPSLEKNKLACAVQDQKPMAYVHGYVALLHDFLKLSLGSGAGLKKLISRYIRHLEALSYSFCSSPCSSKEIIEADQVLLKAVADRGMWNFESLLKEQQNWQKVYDLVHNGAVKNNRETFLLPFVDTWPKNIAGNGIPGFSDDTELVNSRSGASYDTCCICGAPDHLTEHCSRPPKKRKRIWYKSYNKASSNMYV